MNRTIRLKPRPYIVRRNKREEITVLPPGWNKPIDQNPYKVFWSKARLKLEKCKTLVILGYSLPETDLLAQALLAEVVRKREARGNYLKQLHLVDPSKAVKERLVNLFTPAIQSYGEVFKYQGIQDFVVTRLKHDSGVVGREKVDSVDREPHTVRTL